MHIRVEIHVAGSHEPPAGSPVLVQVLDTALQDAPAIVLAEGRGVWGDGPIELEFSPRGDPTVFVSVGDGDFITTQSYPCVEGEMRVEVQKI